jgi:hypothetical protein
MGLAVLLALTVSSYGQKMKAEDVVAKHLDSIGSAELRASLASQISVGDATVNFKSQKYAPLLGRVVLTSAGEKSFLGMRLGSVDYPHEKFSFDGKKVKVAYVRSGVRSVLGNFIFANGGFLEDGLLGGTLMSSWLLHDKTKKPKLSMQGSKKIDGRDVYVLGYSPKGGSDFDINLYFDKETFHHIRTEYKRVASAGIGTSPDQSSRFLESRIIFTENFSDFKAEGGLTLPHTYSLNYLISGQNGTTEIEWVFKLNEFAFNQNLSPNTFDADAN